MGGTDGRGYTIDVWHSATTITNASRADVAEAISHGDSTHHLCPCHGADVHCHERTIPFTDVSGLCSINVVSYSGSR